MNFRDTSTLELAFDDERRQDDGMCGFLMRCRVFVDERGIRAFSFLSDIMFHGVPKPAERT